MRNIMHYTRHKRPSLEIYQHISHWIVWSCQAHQCCGTIGVSHPVTQSLQVISVNPIVMPGIPQHYCIIVHEEHRIAMAHKLPSPPVLAIPMILAVLVAACIVPWVGAQMQILGGALPALPGRPSYSVHIASGCS